MLGRRPKFHPGAPNVTQSFYSVPKTTNSEVPITLQALCDTSLFTFSWT